MMTETSYKTKSIDFATFLVYALPPGSHRSVETEFGFLAFYFDQFEHCKALASEFWGSEPVAIGDLHAFNRAAIAIRRAMKVAKDTGSWNRDDYEEVTE